MKNSKKWSVELELYVQQHTIDLTKQNKEQKKLNLKLKKNVSEILRSLSSLIELRNGSTRNHSNNVAILSTAIAEEIGLTAPEIEMISTASQLHDIGMIGAPDIVLLKNVGELSPDEMTEYVKTPGERTGCDRLASKTSGAQAFLSGTITNGI